MLLSTSERDCGANDNAPREEPLVRALGAYMRRKWAIEALERVRGRQRWVHVPNSAERFDEAQRTALDSHQALGCRGYSRSDLIA